MSLKAAIPAFWKLDNPVIGAIGDKTLDETVRQLQNRVSLYVNESR